MKTVLKYGILSLALFGVGSIWYMAHVPYSPVPRHPRPAEEVQPVQPLPTQGLTYRSLPYCYEAPYDESVQYRFFNAQIHFLERFDNDLCLHNPAVAVLNATQPVWNPRQ